MERGKKVIQIKNIRKDFGKRTVLKDINFDVHEGEVVSIIGSSGSGKSTLLRCINLLEKPTSGEIIFHDSDVVSGKIPLVKLREKVGMVFQQFNLFNNLSVLENCVIGQMKVLKKSRPEAEKKAKELLSKVGMERFINAKPNQISGGQKQRIAIARAILENPQILILDEATSALDNESEKLVQDALERLMKGKTTFIIAHRLSTIINSDKIIVIQEGEIKETGRHEELLEKGEIYKGLYNKSFKREKNL